MVKVIWHKAASPAHTDGSVVFIRWRHCAPPSNTMSWFPGPTRLTIPKGMHLDRFSRFTGLIAGSPYTLQWIVPPLQNCNSRGESVWTPIEHVVPWAHPSPYLKRHLKRFRRFFQGWQSWQTDRATHRPRYSSFLMPKISAKLKRGHPQRRRQMQVE